MLGRGRAARDEHHALASDVNVDVRRCRHGERTDARSVDGSGLERSDVGVRAADVKTHPIIPRGAVVAPAVFDARLVHDLDDLPQTQGRVRSIGSNDGELVADSQAARRVARHAGRVGYVERAWRKHLVDVRAVRGLSSVNHEEHIPDRG